MKKYRILFACVFIFIFVSFAGCEFADIVDYMGLYESSSENQSELQETSSVSETTSSEETSIEETETEPCTHSRTQSVTESKRSCTTHGKIKIVCLDCKETIEKIKKDPLGHQYGGWVTVSEVSADTDGVKYRECGRCKEREYETIPAGYSAGLEFISYGDGTCYLASIGSCKSLDIVVPEVSPNGDIVVAVGNNAFYDEEDFWSEEKICNIRSIVLPDSVEVIGNDAFNTCMNLESVKFPQKLKIIGERAFAFCDALSTVVLPDGVVEIGKSAFSGCIKLTSVKLSKNLKTIGVQPATGESMPPESKSKPRPAEQRGKPPAPFSCPALITAASSRTSTVTVTSGFLTSTRIPRTHDRITPPISRDISGEVRGNFLSERFASTLKVFTPASFWGR